MAPVFDIKIGVYNLVSGMAAVDDRESRFIFTQSGGGGWGEEEGGGDDGEGGSVFTGREGGGGGGVCEGCCDRLRTWKYVKAHSYAKSHSRFGDSNVSD